MSGVSSPSMSSSSPSFLSEGLSYALSSGDTTTWGSDMRKYYFHQDSRLDNSYNIKYISSCFLDESWDCVKDSGKGKVLADAAVEHYWETIYYQHCRYSKSPYEKILRNSTKSQRYIWIRVGVDNFSEMHKDIIQGNVENKIPNFPYYMSTFS